MFNLSFNEISARIKEIKLPEVDFVIGIAEGGIVPASLAAYKLGVELKIIKINFRDQDNKPIYDNPLVLSGNETVFTGKNILIVDDVSVSGGTLKTAKELFPGNIISTLVLKGRNADYVLFPEVSECVNWPWKLYTKGEAV